MYYAIPGRHRGWRNFYSQFVHSGDLSFDIGAHVGNRARALASLGSQVIMLEPQQICQPVLRRLYGRNPSMQLLTKAVGAKKGRGKLLVSQEHPTVSSLSEEWVEEVGASSSFSSVRWDRGEIVEVTTLDVLIEEFGIPSFCKLDVEGFEYEALLGLSQPIDTISFEYIPASIDIAINCVEYLEKLSSYEFNIIEGERPQFSQPGWMNGKKMREILLGFAKYERAGEVYARVDAVK